MAILIILYLTLFQEKEVEYAELTLERNFRGNPEASVVLVEFSDFQCPACAAAQAVAAQVLDDYQGKIKLEFKHLPLTTIHRSAYKAAEAAECAGDQKKFWEYHDLLFNHQNNLESSDLENYASQVGIDIELWRDCLLAHAKKYIIEKDLNEARNLGLNSTPSFFLNGQKVSDWQKLPALVQALVEPVAMSNEQ